MRATKKAVVVISGDFHTNGTTALCPPTVPLREGQYTSTTLQKAIWDQWQIYLSEIESRNRGLNWPVYTILNGELTDYPHKHSGTQFVTLDPNIQFDIAHKVFNPLLEMTDKLWVTKGTEAHSGAGSWTDEALARDFGAIPHVDKRTGSETYARDVVNLSIGGVRFMVQHHPYHSYTKDTMALSAAERNIQKVQQLINRQNEGKTERKKMIPYPDLAIFGHTHRELDSYGLNQNTRVINLPSWKLSDDYGTRLGGGLYKIGGVIILVENGDYEVIKCYHPIVKAQEFTYEKV